MVVAGVTGGICRYASLKYPDSALALGTSMAFGRAGRGFGYDCRGDKGEGAGEYVLSEKVVVDEAGEFPPQPNKEVNLDAPGDFGLSSKFESTFGRVSFGGTFDETFDENIDMVAERECPMLSPYQGPVELDARLRAESLVNLAWFSL
jgi:hypothetical protein